MYVTIRRYRLAGSGAELLRRLQYDFVPIIKTMPGFAGYYVADCGGAEALSITFWAEKQQAERASIVARDWVTRSALGLVPFSPERLSGDVVLELLPAAIEPAVGDVDWVAHLRRVSASSVSRQNSLDAQRAERRKAAPPAVSKLWPILH